MGIPFWEGIIFELISAEFNAQLSQVFKVIWSEPPGEGRLTGGTKISVRGEKFQKVRRFVIINAKNGHCICLYDQPILL
jgi:hypothetical protein